MSDISGSSRAWFKEDVGSRLAERTALMAAIASTGVTFGRSLMPRTLTGQALATGLTGSVNYGLLVTSQSLLWAGVSTVASRFLPEQMDAASLAADRKQVRVAAYGTFAGAAAAAGPLASAIPQEPGESVARSATRAYLQRTKVVALVGLGATAVMDGTLTLAQDRGWSDQRRRATSVGLTLAAGTALATYSVHRQRRKQAAATGEPPPALEPRSVAAGVGTAVGLTFLGQGESAAAHQISRALPSQVPDSVGTALGHTVCLGALGVVAWRGAERLYGKLDAAGSSLETMYVEPPTSATVSGGPASALDWTTLSREGRRFAGTPLTQSEIASVMGGAQSDPVRVFVPLAAAPTPEERASLALAEMIALGAFDRSLMVVCSPTGTGYINYVMAESVEYLTGGDCAIVTVQYSLRPSFLSLDRVKVGRANMIALLTAIDTYLKGLPEDAHRPRLVVFGESLGAHTAQDTSLHEGAAGFTRRGIDRGLFIGTPDRSGWARQWRSDPIGTDPDGCVVEVDSFDQFEALPEERRRSSRFILVSHDEDPITKFGPELGLQRPPWLDPDRSKRPAKIPPEMDWKPLSTLFVTTADVVNSMTVVPGQFGAHGHDYREDLARFVSVAFDLPCTQEQLARMELALRRRELAIAESRLVADQAASARAAAEAALAKWGVAPGSADLLIDETFEAHGLLSAQQRVAEAENAV